MIKKSVTFVAIIIVICIVCGCSKGKNKYQENNNEQNIPSLASKTSKNYKMKTELEQYKTTDERVAILFERYDGKDFQFYEIYNMYKLVDDDWVLLQFKEERKFHDRPYSVKKENNTESKIAKGFQYIYFKDFLDEVGSGKYKIVKSFDEGITSCEFTIQ